MSKIYQVDESTLFDPQSGEFSILPQIILFMADRTIIADDRPVVVNWEVENAYLVSINNTKVAKKGSKEFHFRQSTSLVLTAKNKNNVGVSRVLNIEIDSRSPVIRSFRSNVLCAIVGSPVTLFWEIDQARKILIDNGIGEVSGLNSKTINIGECGIYKITASNYFGAIAEAQLEITIFPIPLVKGIFVPNPYFKFDHFFLSKPFVDVKQLSHLPSTISSQIKLHTGLYTQPKPAASKISFSAKLLAFNLNFKGAYQIAAEHCKKMNAITKLLWKRMLTTWRNTPPN
jgi:hypothetical protein